MYCRDNHNIDDCAAPNKTLVIASLPYVVADQAKVICSPSDKTFIRNLPCFEEEQMRIIHAISNNTFGRNSLPCLETDQMRTICLASNETFVRNSPCFEADKTRIICSASDETFVRKLLPCSKADETRVIYSASDKTFARNSLPCFEADQTRSICSASDKTLVRNSLPCPKADETEIICSASNETLVSSPLPFLEANRRRIFRLEDKHIFYSTPRSKTDNFEHDVTYEIFNSRPSSSSTPVVPHLKNQMIYESSTTESEDDVFSLHDIVPSTDTFSLLTTSTITPGTDFKTIPCDAFIVNGNTTSDSDDDSRYVSCMSFMSRTQSPIFSKSAEMIKDASFRDFFSFSCNVSKNKDSSRNHKNAWEGTPKISKLVDKKSFTNTPLKRKILRRKLEKSYVNLSTESKYESFHKVEALGRAFISENQLGLKKNELNSDSLLIHSSLNALSSDSTLPFLKSNEKTMHELAHFLSDPHLNFLEGSTLSQQKRREQRTNNFGKEYNLGNFGGEFEFDNKLINTTSLSYVFTDPVDAPQEITVGENMLNTITVKDTFDSKNFSVSEQDGSINLLDRERFVHSVAGSYSPSHPMSIKAKLLAAKDPFIIARLSKSVRDKTPSYRGLLPHSKEYTYKEVTKMGGTSSRLISANRVLPITENSNPTHRSVHRLVRNGQREAYKRSWRQDRRLSSYETNAKIPLKTDRIRPKVPKRGTYIKNKAKQTEDKETSGESEKENKEARSIASNSDSLPTSLPSRSDVLPPDGDSLRSDEQKSLGTQETSQNKCTSCSDIQLRLSKANTEKGVLTVCLEKAQSDLAVAQKKVKELELKLSKILENDQNPVTNSKDLEAEMCQLQKEKAILIHELHVTRRQLTRIMDQSDVSDSSHVSSVYVPGSGKDSDDDFRSLGQDEQDDHWKHIKEQLDSANAELNRLKDIETRNEELESEIRHCENRIIKLQEQLKDAEVEKRDASAQTLRKDGTFTRTPPDKTKIPKRLFAGSHSSLPVIPDPVNIHRFRPTTSSLSRVEILQKNLNVKDKEINNLKYKISSLEKDLDKLKNVADLSSTSQLSDLNTENEKLKEELKLAKENYYKETVMRKKYFNMTEEMKGKIRVFCRVKPRNEIRKNVTFLEVPDEYSVLISTQRGTYEFTFDNIFTSENTQEEVFQDVQTLVQSALDGYNVCIFAYGQTGSGKTYTLIGTESHPGIGPRAFQRIFELVRQNQSELDFRICASFFELYNDSLIDLLKIVNEDKLKIRKDHYGLVYVQGSESREVKNEKQLLNLFYEACKNRHIGSTRMNSESSRSHLIVTILIESTNKITGTVLKGKLSLVDLAGSERVGKSVVAAGQLKEANSINKSLSALGDVIAALSSEQQHVPYRNNKLTLLMQDSLGSNAKTLMFVTISSSEQNVEESLNSLTYASRVKQITNAATRMAESKEIARLRSIIMKLSKEERANGRM